MSGKDDKTEKPTSIRRRKAREEGQVAQSQQVSSTMALIGALTTLAWVLSYRDGFRGFFARTIDLGRMTDTPEAWLLGLVNEAGSIFSSWSLPC